MDYLFPLLFSSFFLVTISICLLVLFLVHKNNQDFETNSIVGEAEVIGYEREQHSSRHYLTVRILGIGNNKHYGCQTCVKPHDYPVGSIVPIRYLFHKTLGIKSCAIRLISNEKCSN